MPGGVGGGRLQGPLLSRLHRFIQLHLLYLYPSNRLTMMRLRTLRSHLLKTDTPPLRCTDGGPLCLEDTALAQLGLRQSDEEGHLERVFAVRLMGFEKGRCLMRIGIGHRTRPMDRLQPVESKGFSTLSARIPNEVALTVCI